jgi:hypothetical protein
LDHSNGPPKVGPSTIHFVNETDAWHAIAISLPPDSLRLGFHPSYRIKDYDTTVQNAQGTLHFGGEINVPRCINDVNLVFAPEAGDSCGGDSDAALPFLLHPIGDRCTLVHAAHAMGATSVEKHPLSRSRLARINVSDYSYVARPFQRVLSVHGKTHFAR